MTEKKTPIISEGPEVRAARLKQFHTNRHSIDPEYMSDDFREFRIKPTKNNRWRISCYAGNFYIPELKGEFSTFKEAESRLIRLLHRYNRGFARYPGCPKPRPTSYTEHFLKDWSPKPAR